MFLSRLFSGKEDHQEAQGIECDKCKVKTSTGHCTICKENLCDAYSNVHHEQDQSKSDLCTQYVRETDVDQAMELTGTVSTFGKSSLGDNDHGKDKQSGRANDTNNLQSSDSDCEEWYDAETTMEWGPRKQDDVHIDRR